MFPLPNARVPILKISRPPGADAAAGVECDIGFDNQHALDNTQLLLRYAMVDPARVRPLVLFVKVWAKRRGLNSPYTGTLSSYGFTLLVLFYLVHVAQPPVLPNLQRIPNDAPSGAPDAPPPWTSQNTNSLGELFLDFFRYYARDMNYTKDALALETQGGLLAKDAQAWTDCLFIEDPLQRGYNVARTVTKDGLYMIRGEFMRAGRLLGNRAVYAPEVLTELCEERHDEPSPAQPKPRRDRPGTP